MTISISTARTLGGLALAATVAVSLHAAGQDARGGRGSAGTGRPITRTAWDNKPDFSGVWLQATQVDRDPANGNLNLLALDRLYRPDVKPLRDSLKAVDSPDYHCAPQAYPMAMSVPHPIQLVQVPDTMVVLTEYLHGFRAIPTDGRPHDPSARPSHVGESVGHWEGDTLVVDVTRFNGKQWLALAQQGGAAGGRGRGGPAPQPVAAAAAQQQNVWPGSAAMHIVERWSLVDADTLEYQAVVDDPKMLTGPWTSAKMHRGKLKYDIIQEDICIDDAIERNLAGKGDAKH